MTPEETPVDPAIEKRYTRQFATCQTQAHDTQQNIRCFEAEFVRQDTQLNQAWRALVSRLPAAERRPLVLAQRKWIAERDRFCRSYSDEWGEGTIRPIIHASCRVEQTIRRTMWLEALRR